MSESKSLKFRLGAFNTFNHVQFYGPAFVNDNISNANSASRQFGCTPARPIGSQVLVLDCRDPAAAVRCIVLAYGIVARNNGSGVQA